MMDMSLNGFFVRSLMKRKKKRKKQPEIWPSRDPNP
jgi:hypothetical protein